MMANIETALSVVEFILIANKVKRWLIMIISLWSIWYERNAIREMSSLLLGEKQCQA